jgi:hypothetical protein
VDEGREEFCCAVEIGMVVMEVEGLPDIYGGVASFLEVSAEVFPICFLPIPSLIWWGVQYGVVC